MILTVHPVSRLTGTISLPASKSYSIRAFIIAACGGHSCIINPSDCDDARVALSVARQMGIKIIPSDSETWILQAGQSKRKPAKINVRESGTVLRFLLPLLSLHDQKVCVVGEGTLRGRPNHHLLRVLRAKGVRIKGQGARESVPINLSGGQLSGGRFEIDGSLSSQFISALLIACAQLSQDTEIRIKGRRLVSSDYITMTQQVMEKGGITIRKVNNRLYKIRGRQSFKGLGKFRVPSDYGLAAFLLGAGALVKSNIVLKGNLRDDLIQADGRILELLRKMGVRFSQSKRALRMRGPFPLKGGRFSLKNCPDLVPIMAVLALFAKGETRLVDIKHARVKESDRISDLRNELLKIGAKVTEKENELIIYPSPVPQMNLSAKKGYKQNVLLDPHHDHRLAMAFSVLGLKCGVRIKDIECVSKSYPGFVRDLKNLGARIHG